MADLAQIKDFIQHKKFLLYGASRSGKKFGNSVLTELTKKGYSIFPVHPEVSSINNVPAYRDVRSVAEKVEAAILVIPPKQVEYALADLNSSGIKNIWLQQGAESEEAIRYCRENGMKVIHGECILMFAEPVESFHKFHRWIWRLIGKYPK